MYNWSRPLRALFVAGVDEDHPCPFFPSCSQSAAHGSCWPFSSTATPEASSVRCTASGDLHVDAHSLTVPLAHGSPEPPDHAPFRLPPPPTASIAPPRPHRHAAHPLRRPSVLSSGRSRIPSVEIAAAPLGSACTPPTDTPSPHPVARPRKRCSGRASRQ